MVKAKPLPGIYDRKDKKAKKDGLSSEEENSVADLTQAGPPHKLRNTSGLSMSLKKGSDSMLSKEVGAALNRTQGKIDDGRDESESKITYPGDHSSAPNNY